MLLEKKSITSQLLFQKNINMKWSPANLLQETHSVSSISFCFLVTQPRHRVLQILYNQCIQFFNWLLIILLLVSSWFKDMCYADKPEINDALKDNICEAFVEIQLHLIDNALKIWSSRLLHDQPRQSFELKYFTLLTEKILLTNKWKLRKYSIVFFSSIWKKNYLDPLLIFFMKSVRYNFLNDQNYILLLKYHISCFIIQPQSQNIKFPLS